MKHPDDANEMVKHLEAIYDHTLKNHDIQKGNIIYKYELVQANFEFLHYIIDMVKNKEELNFVHFTELLYHSRWLASLRYDLANIRRRNLSGEK